MWPHLLETDPTDSVIVSSKILPHPALSRDQTARMHMALQFLDLERYALCTIELVSQLSAC